MAVRFNGSPPSRPNYSTGRAAPSYGPLFPAQRSHLTKLPLEDTNDKNVPVVIVSWIVMHGSISRVLCTYGRSFRTGLKPRTTLVISTCSWL